MYKTEPKLYHKSELKRQITIHWVNLKFFFERTDFQLLMFAFSMWR